jgi:hypothetical protein
MPSAHPHRTAQPYQPFTQIPQVSTIFLESLPRFFLWRYAAKDRFLMTQADQSIAVRDTQQMQKMFSKIAWVPPFLDLK